MPAVNIDLKKLEGLLKVLEERDISEFEFEDEAVRVHLRRGQPVMAVAQPMPHAVTASHAVEATASTNSVPEAAAVKQADGNVAYVTSPFVGTFYRSPSPDAPAFCDVGSVVRPGQTLCIIEAMKLMNEIEAECSGTIVEIFAQNGKSVEYGQKLLRIKKA